MRHNLGLGDFFQRGQVTNMVSVVMYDDNVAYIRMGIAQPPYVFKYLCNPAPEPSINQSQLITGQQEYIRTPNPNAPYATKLIRLRSYVLHIAACRLS